ncbi:MAG: DUF4062 domain-containing protein [Aggregatilineales bacterium]
MSSALRVFISSKMSEVAAERQCLAALVPTLSNDTDELHPWMFEKDAPATSRSIREVFIESLYNSALYIGVFWNEYGEWTIDEFDRAGEHAIDRHVYVKNVEAEKRDPRLTAFLEKHSHVTAGITAKWFTTLDELREYVTKSIEVWLHERALRRAGAPGATLAKAPHDIADQPEQLFGRDVLRNEVHEQLDGSGRVLLQGLGGMGKTALARVIAAERLAAGKGPLLWLRIGNTELEPLLELLAQPFGMQQAVASQIGEAKLNTLALTLAERGIRLVVLDDGWVGNDTLRQVVAAIPREIGVLITSRQRYTLPNLHILKVGELVAADALALLGSFNHHDYATDAKASELCLQLGYHPFALEIAAKTLQLDELTPAQLLKRISDAPHDMPMPQDFAENGRASVKDLLDASIAALDKDARAVFEAFGGLFSARATPELLGLCLKRSTEKIDAGLTVLQRRGLAERFTLPGNDEVYYYRIHDLSYSYARTLFKKHHKRGAEQKVLAACREYTKVHRDAPDRLDVERVNLFGAANRAEQIDDDATLIEIIWLLAVDGPYFAARGHTALSLDLLGAAIEFAKRAGRLEEAHFLLSKLGNAHRDLTGNLNAAFAAYSEAYELAKTLGNARRQALLLAAIGTVRFMQNEADFDDYMQRAATIAEVNQDDFARCYVYHYQGYQALKRPNATPADYEHGARLSSAAASLAARLEQYELQFFSLINRGGCEQELGKTDQALVTHQDAYQLAVDRDNYLWMAEALYSMGEDCHILDDREGAQKSFDQAIALWQKAQAVWRTKKATEEMIALGYVVKGT